MPNIKTHTYCSDGKCYDVYKLIQLSKDFDVVEKSVADFMKELETPCWNDELDDMDTTAIYSPIDVINKKEHSVACKKHYDRAMSTELIFPIIINGELHVVADGMHRLLKAYILGEKTIKTVTFAPMPLEALV